MFNSYHRALYNWRNFLHCLSSQYHSDKSILFNDMKRLIVNTCQNWILCLMQKNALCWQTHQNGRIKYWKSVQVYSGLWHNLSYKTQFNFAQGFLTITLNVVFCPSVTASILSMVEIVSNGTYIEMNKHVKSFGFTSAKKIIAHCSQIMISNCYLGSKVTLAKYNACLDDQP